MNTSPALFALASFVLVGAAATAAPSADPVKGRAVFARCMGCHDLNTGANRLGPSLKAIMGRKSGTYPGFQYSPAMKAKKITWTATTIDAFLAAPTRYVLGSKMALAPIASAQDRANLIAYLQQAAK